MNGAFEWKHNSEKLHRETFIHEIARTKEQKKNKLQTLQAWSEKFEISSRKRWSL